MLSSDISNDGDTDGDVFLTLSKDSFYRRHQTSFILHNIAADQLDNSYNNYLFDTDERLTALILLSKRMTIQH